MIRALLGGSFDPFHHGHLALVRAVLERRLADRVLVVPAQRSPHKDPAQAAGHHRLAMARLALGGIDKVDVLALEIERGGISYTVDTLETLNRRWPTDRWRLVLGADNLASFFRWRDPWRLLAIAELLVFARGNWTGSVPTQLKERAIVVRDFQFPASATEVRAGLADGLWPVDKVPGVVLDYIAANRLYGVDRDPGVDMPAQG